jgi:uncharacterized DUF497 family protein
LKIKSLIWLDEVIEKLSRKHNVSPDEVKEILGSNPHCRFVEKGHRQDENVYSALGQTQGGRYLIVFFVYKRGGGALVLSARDMTPRERKRYEEN